MVSRLNQVIEAACEANGAMYVDIDLLFDGHRFCEEGVQEPSNDESTWFFTLDYRDSREDERSTQQMLSSPFKDYFAMVKAFHPTAAGHKAIAGSIARTITKRQSAGP